jgi:hypothetical protein
MCIYHFVYKPQKEKAYMEPFVVNLGKRGGTVNSKIGAVNVLPI